MPQAAALFRIDAPRYYCGVADYDREVGMPPSNTTGKPAPWALGSAPDETCGLLSRLDCERVIHGLTDSNAQIAEPCARIAAVHDAADEA